LTETDRILARCQGLGIRLGLGLRVEGWSKAPADLQDAIRLHKDALLGTVQRQTDKEAPSTAEATGMTTPWGIPIPDDWDPNDPVFRRHPLECDCFRTGTLRCGIPCVWAWPPGAKVGDQAPPLRREPMRKGVTM